MWYTCLVGYFNPRSPHGERPRRCVPSSRWLISTHAPRTGSDLACSAGAPDASLFQPTLPARGATTPRQGDKHHAPAFQPTLPARGATLFVPALHPPAVISTHAPRTGSDPCGVGGVFPGDVFQPTLPARGATWVEIHRWLYAIDFNPRSPHGERPAPITVFDIHYTISTHAPRTGSDAICYPDDTGTDNFNPRSPHGERPCGVGGVFPGDVFQPTLPARGATCTVGAIRRSPLVFQPTLPARGATSRDALNGAPVEISTHAPRTGSDARA